MDRAGLIADLLCYKRSMQEVVASLAAYGWDGDEPLADLKRSHIRQALRRYIRTELSASQIEEWANIIECRDDIAYEPSSLEGDIIFELANSELTQQLNPAWAERLLQPLSVDPQYPLLPKH
jgi:hypothetical protein